MRNHTSCLVFLCAALCGCAIAAQPSSAADTGSQLAPDRAEQVARGRTLFISYGCGYCHENGGRQAGKGPQLMDTTRDDDFILNRIATGSEGKMPAFGSGLTGADFHALVAYIRSLKAGD
jgi:mono/diheme cytochrome c family protein